jgi:hypothetical protein
MADRKISELTQATEVQTGDRYVIARGAQNFYVTQEDNNSPRVGDSAVATTNLVIGQPIYITGAGQLAIAQADSLVTSRVQGLVVSQSVSTGFSGLYASFGIVERSDWTSVIGSLSLSIGSRYFLDPNTAGRMTTLAPSMSGEIVIALGIAVTANKFSIDIDTPVLL